MPQDDYEYRGMMATYWDLLRGDTSNWEDRFFFREAIARRGQPVLDVGCGTGRLLLDFMQQGIDIDGVDNSPEMLALLREKAEKLGLRPNVYLQAMEEIDLPRRYRTIMVPSSSFQLVIDPADAARAMAKLFDHLEPGGTLVMPFMIIWTGSTEKDIVEQEWDEAFVRERARPEDGIVVRRWSRSTFDIPNKLEHTEDRYELVKDGEVIRSELYSRSPATRWYSQEEAVDLYRKAGFENIQVTSEFTFEPVKPDDTTFCVLGTKPL